ncbi:MAG: efflux RND transporter periplasmic adaptor subunit [Planctomycetaceae bacterium]|nr:efflux RND transporter periplasmic adaptor subunit [Planctomycetaceae bacterium]
MNTTVKAFLMMLSVAVCAGVSYAVYQYSELKSQTAETKREKVPQAVEVITLQQQPISDRIELVGTLQPNAATTLRPKSNGYITEIRHDIGEFVEAEEVVVELDKSRAHEMVAQAEAALKVSEAQLKASQTQLKEQQDNLSRIQKLYESNVVTKQELLTAESQKKLADAEVELNQAMVDQAKSAVLSAKIDLKECSIATTMPGYVAERFAEPGDLADSATILMRLVDISSVYTVVNVTERDYDKIKENQTARIEVDAYPGKSFEGFVESIAPQIDIETRTAAVKIRIENEESYLKPGMYARVSLLCGERPEANVIPLATVLEENGKPYVYVVDPKTSTANKQIIEKGIIDGNLVEVKQGLSTDDRIVTLGNRLITDGETVTVMESPVEQYAFRDAEVDQDPTSDSAAE